MSDRETKRGIEKRYKEMGRVKESKEREGEREKKNDDRN